MAKSHVLKDTAEEFAPVGMIPVYLALVDAAGKKPRIIGAPYVLSCVYRCHPTCVSASKRGKDGRGMIRANTSALPLSDANVEAVNPGSVFMCPRICDMHGEITRRFVDIKKKYSLKSDVRLTLDIREAANSLIEVIYNIHGDVPDVEQKADLLTSIRNGISESINSLKLFQK
jgi:hypothetical protein